MPASLAGPETSWSSRSRGKVEARTGWSAFSGALGERASLFDRKPCLLPYGPVGLPSRGIPRRLLVVAVGGGRDRLLRVALASRLCALSPNGRRLRCRTDGCPALVLVGVGGPSSGLLPEQAACGHRQSSLTSTSEAAALLQGEEDGRPGTVVLSNPAVRQG